MTSPVALFKLQEPSMFSLCFNFSVASASSFAFTKYSLKHLQETFKVLEALHSLSIPFPQTGLA
jgi:hypothetical protein